MSNQRHILITGASSGLGQALACLLAKPGVTLALTGRDPARLGKVVETCKGQGADVVFTCLDVRDRDSMALWLAKITQASPLDLVIANAGISGETGLPGDVPDLARDIIDINIQGTLNTVQPLLPDMIARRRGQICVVASLAGMRGMPRGPAYSASKAALIALSEAWRVALAPHNVHVSAACPGYIHTALTQRHAFSLPFVVSAEDAAHTISKGLQRKSARIIVPPMLAPVGWCFRALPSALTNWMIPGPKAARQEVTDD